MEEQGIIFDSNGVFYNPNMKLSREISNIVIRNIEDRLRILDGFSASGIRGMIYSKNRNVERVDFLDYSEKAISLIKKNLKKNSIEGKVIKEEFNRYIINTEEKYNLIEIDPFGSPNPYLYDAIRYLSKMKRAYLSTTATDLQVLCGVQRKACLKHYQSNSKNHYFCHELGMRILLKKIVLIASDFNMSVMPLISFYYRHQFKTIVKLERDEKMAYEQLKNIKYLNFDEDKVIFEVNDNCNKGSLGPIWAGNLHDERVLKKMEGESKEGKKMIELFKEENDFPPYFYSTHYLAKKLRINPISLKKLREDFEKIGFSFSLTHFSSEGFKSREKSERIIEFMKSYRRGVK